MYHVTAAEHGTFVDDVCTIGKREVGMEDRQALEALVEAYRKGSFTNDAELLASIFHEDAWVSGVIGEETISIPASEFVEVATGEPESAEQKGCNFTVHIDQVDIDGPVALVKFHEYDNNGTDYITRFLCMKHGECWTVRAKMFLVV